MVSKVSLFIASILLTLGLVVCQTHSRVIYNNSPQDDDSFDEVMSYEESCSAAEYLRRRPDVAATGMTAWDHYVSRGKDERMCRPPRPNYNNNVKYRPLVFVGTTYYKATKDMYDRPHEWEYVRNRAGFHFRPESYLKHCPNIGADCQKKIPSLYKHKWVMIESDLYDWNYKGSMHIPNSFYRINQDKSYKIGGHVSWVRGDRFGSPSGAERVANDLRDFFKDSRASKVRTYFFFTIADGYSINATPFLKQPKDGLPLWVWIAKKAGCTGIALDLPPMHYARNRAHQDFAHHIARTSRQYGLEFIWSSNGGSSLQDTRFLVDTVRRNSIHVDVWLIDHFENPNYLGVPETGETVTGQAKVILQAYGK